MRLATARTANGTRAVRVEDDHAVDLGVIDVGALLAQPDWQQRAAADGPAVDLAGLDYAPVVPRPEKIVCVGLNYRTHILEMGRDLPTHPTLFAKFHRALIGAYDGVVLPAVSQAVDWEAELGVVVGSTLRRADVDTARAAIAGYTVVNDVTERDWQYRTTQWLQGKAFEDTTPVGPWLVTDGAQDVSVSRRISCEVNGTVVQESDTADLVFDPATLLAYISQIVTLVPGDLVATGTPGGVGHAREPKWYLQDGDVLTTRIEGVGELSNRCCAERT